MDILLHFDENAYSNLINSVKHRILPVLQEIIDDYSNLKIEDLTNEDLAKLFNTPEILVFDKITGGQLQIGEIHIDKAKAMEIIVKPNGYDAFINKVKMYEQKLKDTRLISVINYATPSNISNYFLLDENKQIVINNELEEKVKKSFKRYAKSNAAKKMLEFGNFIVDKYNELEIEEIHQGNGGLERIFNELLIRNEGTGITLYYDGIMRYNNNSNI